MDNNTIQAEGDVYSYEIIGKARELSPELDSYIVAREYLNEIHDDDITPLWLRNKLITKLVEQLEDRGVIIEMERDDICDSPRMVQTVLYLRSKFDIDKLYDFLSDHTESLAALQQLAGSDEDYFEEFVEQMHHLNPLDEGWECIVDTLNQNPGVIHGDDDEFLKLVDRVLERVDRLGNPDSASITGNFDGIVDYVQFLNNRKQKILRLAQAMCNKGALTTSDTGSVEVSVESYMRNFEAELSQPKVIESIPGSKEGVSELINTTRANNVEHWRHTLQHWISDQFKNQEPTELDVAVMVATLYTDVGDTSTARVKIIETFENNAIALGPRYEKLRNMLDDALANLVVFQEQGGVVNVVK